jgi:hypothetical protein
MMDILQHLITVGEPAPGIDQKLEFGGYLIGKMHIRLDDIFGLGEYPILSRCRDPYFPSPIL